MPKKKVSWPDSEQKIKNKKILPIILNTFTFKTQLLLAAAAKRLSLKSKATVTAWCGKEKQKKYNIKDRCKLVYMLMFTVDTKRCVRDQMRVQPHDGVGFYFSHHNVFTLLAAKSYFHRIVLVFREIIFTLLDEWVWWAVWLGRWSCKDFCGALWATVIEILRIFKFKRFLQEYVAVLTKRHYILDGRPALVSWRLYDSNSLISEPFKIAESNQQTLISS